MSTPDQIISNIGSIANVVMAILAIVTAIIAFRSYKDGKKRKKREKAIELSQFYMEKIIKPSTFITEVLNNSKFGDIVKKAFTRDNIEKFDKDEINSLLKKSGNLHNYESLKATYLTIEAESILKASMFCDDFAMMTKMTSECVSLLEPDNDENKKKMAELAIRVYFNKSINEFINNLEWFAMNFISGVADDQTVYQSLHQTYLGFVAELYFFFARNNNAVYAKYFTNTIELFKKWRKQENEIKEQENMINDSAQKFKDSLSKHQKSL